MTLPRSYSTRYLLFKNQDDLVFVLEDVFEMNNPVGF